MKKLFLILPVILFLNSCEKNDGKQTHVENRKPDTLVAGYSKNPIEIKENKVNYKFVSEGVTSEREIYFLQDSGVLLEGTGNYSNNNSSKLTYESPKAVKYSSANRLNPVDCKSIK